MPRRKDITITIKASTYGQGRKNLNRALANLESFRTGGALSGDRIDTVIPGVYVGGYGQLDSEHRDMLRADASAQNIVYVVKSYDTPIAWVLTDGTVRTVSQRFSVTTSKHQGTLYMLGRTDLV